MKHEFLKVYIAILLSFTGLNVFAQPMALLHKTHAQQYHFLDSFWVEISRLSTFDGAKQAGELANWAFVNNDKSLAQEFRMLKLRRIFFDNELGDQAIPEYTATLAGARKSGNKYLEAELLHTYGFYLGTKRKYESGFEYLLASYNIYGKMQAEEFPHKQEYLYEFGSAYYAYGDYETAIRYFKESLETKEYNRGSVINSLYNSIGVAYRYTNNYDSSEKYLRAVYERALKNNDSVWEGIAGGNIGINYFGLKRYDEAVPLLDKDVELSKATHNLKEVVSTKSVLATIYLDEGRYEKAEQEAKEALYIGMQRSFWYDKQLAGNVYMLLFRICMAKNEWEQAALYADSAIMAKDSATVQFNKLNFAKSNEKFQYVQHKMEVEQLKNQKERQELLRNSLVALILMLSVITLLFINRQRLKQKQLEGEKKNAEFELVNATTQLETFKQSVQEKNSIIERFTEELEKVKSGENAESDTELLSKLETAIILTDEQWENFRQMFEKVHKGFFTKLKKKIPDITQAEIRFLALTKLKLSSKEMASMLGISLNAIRVYRYRLRKRLDMDKDDMIEELVENL